MDIFKTKYIPFWIMGIIGALICVLTEWTQDAIVYQYIIQWGGGDPVPTDKVENIGDIFLSQYNHYFYANGRFFVHILVQLFCALFGKYVFALCNGVVWGLLPAACLKVSGLKINLKNAIMTSVLLILLFYFLRPDPPFQINYVWMSLMVCGFLLIFFREKTYGVVTLCLIALYSFCCGEGNEGFSFVTGVAIIYYACMRKFRLSAVQWVSGLSFGVGTLVQLIAPANWMRFDKMVAASDILVSIETFIPALIIPLIFIGILISTRANNVESQSNPMSDKVIWSGVLAGYLLCFVLKFSVGARLAIPANLFLLFLILRILEGVKINSLVYYLGSIAALAIMTLMTIGDVGRSALDRRIYDAYRESADGKVYVDDKDFSDNINRLKEGIGSYDLKAQTLSPGKPGLTIVPASMKKTDVRTDKNRILKLEGDAWLLIRSKEQPAEFIVKKRLLPGVIDKSMSDRELDFSSSGDIAIDSTATYIVGVYKNDRPYIDAEVIMK